MSNTWLSLGKSTVQIAADFSPIPGLGPAAEVLCALIQLCENVAVNRNATRKLCERCHTLLIAVEKYKPTPPNTTEGAWIDVTDTLQNVEKRARSWTQYSRARALLKQQDVKDGIENCKRDLELCFQRLELASAADNQRWQSEFAIMTRADHEEVIAYLSEIQIGQEIVQEITVLYGDQILQEHQTTREELRDVKQVMVTMQQQLASLAANQPQNENAPSRTQQYDGLCQNLHKLQVTSKTLLPDLHLKSGEITDIQDRPISGNASMDIFQGRYLQNEVVAIKVVRAIEPDEHTMRRFNREVQIWQKVWNLDKGRYILPFYGFYQAEDVDARAYMVSPWQDNGTAVKYIRKNDSKVDYRKMITDIARGIHVLHCLMSPSVVHGDIRGENILIDANGNPLIADFGLSKMVEDMTSTPFTQSNGVANLYRWFAPEVYIGRGSVSLASDMFSFAMTVLELMTHAPPFATTRHPPEVVIKVSNGRNPDRPTDPRVIARGLDDQLWGILVQCWNRIPSARPGIGEVLEGLEGLRG